MKNALTIVGIIPARMNSSRFPGKPLAPILKIPMIGHVYFRSAMSRMLDAVCIATCDSVIRRYAVKIGASCIMTSPRHKSASDRTAEALVKLEKQLGRRADIVVMIQGDEPMLRPQMIDDAIAPLLNDNSLQVVNLMAPLKNKIEHSDPNEVKVVVDQRQNALYFSREPIPSWKKGAQEVPMQKQVCIIPFRREFLIKFNALKSTPLERIESIDMLRLLEHGYTVRMVPTRHETYSVDTPADLTHVRRLMKIDRLMQRYKNL